MNLRPALICLLFAAASAGAATSRDVPDIQVSATQEKTNAVLNLDKAAVAAMIDKETFDGMVGVTSDFQHAEVPAYVVFADSVTEDKLMELANFQGRLKGVMHCKRIRLGTSPLFPHVKLGVLAEQCTIKSLNH